tara:strand:- start:48 stop:455 length:408 start_codon:yes stop_codon:yes gene_type:complete
MNKIKKHILIFLLVLVVPFPTFSETYLCVEDKDSMTDSDQENSDRENVVFNRISDDKFEATLIGSDQKLSLDVHFEDDEVISLILPRELSKFMLFMFSLNKKDNTYIGIMHLISEPITEKINIFDVFDKGKCQLL